VRSSRRSTGDGSICKLSESRLLLPTLSFLPSSDLASYSLHSTFRLLLEYRRAMAHDRDAMVSELFHLSLRPRRVKLTCFSSSPLQSMGGSMLI